MKAIKLKLSKLLSKLCFKLVWTPKIRNQKHFTVFFMIQRLYHKEYCKTLCLPCLWFRSFIIIIIRVFTIFKYSVTISSNMLEGALTVKDDLSSEDNRWVIVLKRSGKWGRIPRKTRLAREACWVFLLSLVVHH